jgi:glucose-1-phosphate cytidylyltransferase
MQVVILAGGFGTRLSEETELKPKPMVEIGGKPILWHIMKIYSHYGFNEFIICLGYKGYVIKEYFANYFLHQSDVTIDLLKNKMEIHKSNTEPWKVTLVDTGLETMTGGRLKRIEKYINGEEFFMTYGDGVADIDINKLLSFHRRKKKKATITAVKPPGRFGALVIDGKGNVEKFQEKPAGDGNWINGGFFVLHVDVFKYIDGDDTVWEREPLERLTQDQELVAYRHSGFWKAMDTLRDKIELEKLWKSNNASWKVWNR